jgi:serine/threonine protein kinase
MSGLPAGHVVASRYEVLSPLGAGGMGAVYKVYDRVLDETVALKVLRFNDAAHVARFRSEVKLAWRVRHRNVCALHEYGEDAGAPYITMEYVDGIDLKRLVRAGGLLWEDAYDLAVQAGEGLCAIHEAGVIHRDLKPANIMRDRQGVVRLMDFGIARGSDGVSLTRTGDVLGSPQYMSPEQIRGEADFRSDLYAFGAVLYELFTGQACFGGKTSHEVIAQHLEAPPPLEGPLAARLPVALVPILRRALAKRAEDRFASCQEMLVALGEARLALAEQETDAFHCGLDSSGVTASRPFPPADPRPVAGGVSAYPAEAGLLVPVLLRALRHADPAVRSDAAQALGRGRHAEALEALQGAATDLEPAVRASALLALRALGRVEPAP